MSTIIDNKNDIEILKYGIELKFTNEVIKMHDKQNPRKPIISTEVTDGKTILSPSVLRKYDLDLYNLHGRFGAVVVSHKEHHTKIIEVGYEVVRFKANGVAFSICAIAVRRNVVFEVYDAKGVFIAKIPSEGLRQVHFELFEVADYMSILSRPRDIMGGEFLPHFTQNMNDLYRNPNVLAFFQESTLRYMKDIINDVVFDQLETPVITLRHGEHRFLNNSDRTEELQELSKKFKVTQNIQFNKINDHILELLLVHSEKYFGTQYREAAAIVAERNLQEQKDLENLRN